MLKKKKKKKEKSIPEGVYWGLRLKDLLNFVFCLLPKLYPMYILGT